MHKCLRVFVNNHTQKPVTSRVHNISRKGECLTAYTCFKGTALSTKSTHPPGVNYISAPNSKALTYFVKPNVCIIVYLILSTSMLWLIVIVAYCSWIIKL